MVKKPEIIIEAKALEFNYPGDSLNRSSAINGIDMTVNRGEYLAIIGPNGSGKTTLLKLFNALLAPSGGEVLVEGISTVDHEKVPLIRRSCGMIFQNPDNQLVATTVEEDIAFGLENLALPSAEIRQRVTEVAQRLHLDKLLLHPPHLLSGGEKQRVAIAGILAMQPRCILMDEPTAMLDPSGRREVLDTVKALNREEGIAIIHVTHFPEEAAHADRVLVLNQGEVVEDGPAEIILTDLEMLHSYNLQGTAVVELAALLRQDGFNLPTRILHNRELVNSLCQYERKS
ncbi:MAG: energy-coupling factor transporter ATPase [Bacillota bacterium]|nr:energy-coupling factor transporter ATPase [Bacillota bacterium]MDW7729457.1 energy-coupling factor transporter ATPase [Bacillota bacterium]